MISVVYTINIYDYLVTMSTQVVENLGNEGRCFAKSPTP